jgi:hypothetical protein
MAVQIHESLFHDLKYRADAAQQNFSIRDIGFHIANQRCQVIDLQWNKKCLV